MIPNAHRDAAVLAIMVARSRRDTAEAVYTQQHNAVGRAVLEVLGTVSPLIEAIEHVLRDPLTANISSERQSATGAGPTAATIRSEPQSGPAEGGGR
jgi:hypothetical protein